MRKTEEGIKQNSTGYPSIDKPWLKYYTEDDLNLKVPECTVFQNIYDNNKDHPDDIALNYYGNKISYNTLFSKVEGCARSLRTIGIGKGDCVNLCTSSVPEAVYVALACSRIGAIANFINPLFSQDQMIDRINDTGAEWIIILDTLFELIEPALQNTCVKRGVIIPATNSISFPVSRVLFFNSDARKILKRRNRGNQEFFSWDEFIVRGQNYDGSIDIGYEKDTSAVMVYSSGSTGASKGILLTNDGINAFITAYKTTGYSDMANGRGLIFLQMIPIWFSTGVVYSILMPLSQGFTVILEPKFSKESFAKDLKKYKPQMTLAATSLWLYVANSDLPIDLSNMKYPVSGGEKILPREEKRVNDYLKKNGCKKRFYKGYGMCELGSEVSGTTDVDNYHDKRGGVGYPMLNVSVAAFNIDTDEELKYGECGEIRVCSPARMKGYYKNPKATDEFFKTDNEGKVWGCTGDIGYVDEDGELFVLGRSTDCYKRENGETVYLFYIEEEIFKEASVNQCKVVDIHDRGQTCLVAHIVFDEGTSETDQKIKSIHNHLTEKLPEYMLPGFYKVRTSMPVHSNGKRDVETLRSDQSGLIEIKKSE